MTDELFGLRKRLAETDRFTWIFSIIPNPAIVEIIADAGFDGVILDCEHGPFGREALAPLILAAKAGGIFPVVRVSRPDPAEIGAALDIGAAGIIVPQIGTVEEARSAVASARFAPLGNRGANPWVSAAQYAGDSSWFSRANRETAVILMIEGREAVDSLTEILAIPALDGIFIGPIDLSHSLGVPGEVSHPSVIAKARDIVRQARRVGKTVSIFAATSSAAKFWFAEGVSTVALGVDTAHIRMAMRQVFDEVAPK